MDEIRLQVVIDEALPDTFEEPVIALGEGFTPSETVLVYKSDPDNLGASALQRFYRDLIFGKPLPIKIVARAIQDIDEVMILALFLDRKLAVQPTTASVVFGCDLGRFGPAGLAHVDRDLARFISFARGYLEGRKAEVKTVVEWLRTYILEGTFPALPPEPKPPRVLDIGSNGFVVAESSEGDLVEAWTELYRLGHLRGVLFRQAAGGRTLALGARKGPEVLLDLDAAASVLNDAEMAMGEPPGWIGEALWLWGPETGTLLRPTDILGVLARV